MDNLNLISGVASRYAGSLFALAEEQGQVDTVRAELQALQKGLGDSREFRALVTSPILPAATQIAALEKVLDAMKVSALTANFLKLLAANRRLAALSQAVSAFNQMADEKNGIVHADVTSAEALSDAQTAALKSALKDTTGKDVSLRAKIDQSLIGGLVVKLGSRMIDTSLKTKLSNMKTALKGIA